MKKNTPIISNVPEVIKARGLNKTEVTALFAIVGLSYGTGVRARNGATDFTLATAILISRALELPVTDLFQESE